MLNTQQTKIYEGLKQIGEALANFYLDAIDLIDPSCSLASKANLIAHLAREIDGGIRDAFSPIDKKVEKEKELKGKGLKDVGHFASILVLLGKEDVKNNIANEWLEIATKFPALAHRHKVYQSSLDSKEIIELWNKYEKILFIIIGSNYSITNRLDSLIKIYPPTENGLNVLKNLISYAENASYFFRNLTEISWLNVLFDQGFFSIENAPKQQDEKELEEWHSLKYLVNISTTEEIQAINKIKQFLKNVIVAYLNEGLELHALSIQNISKIILQLKEYPFSKEIKVFFIKVNSKTNQFNWDFYNTSLIERLPQKHLDNKDKESLKNLLDYAFGFYTSEKPAVILIDFKLPIQVEIKSFIEGFALSEFTKEYGKSIIELIGSDTIKICTEKIKSIIDVKPLEFSSSDFPSIEVTNQTHSYSSLQSELVNFIRDFSTYLCNEELKALITDFIHSNTEILQRVGLHLVRINFKEFKDIWWKFVSQFDTDLVVTHEPYILIQETSKDYSENEIKVLVDWIEKTKEHDFHVENYSAKESRYFNIRKWLAAFDEKVQTSSEYLKEKIKFYNKLNNWEIQHPEFDSYFTSYTGYKYPMEINEFSDYTIENQISYLKKFQPDYKHSSEAGLGELVKSCVAKNPDKYLTTLNQFLTVQNVYINKLIEGLTSSIISNTILDYKPILSFVEVKISSDTFLNEIKTERYYKQQLLFSLTRLFNALIDTKPSFDFSKEDLLILEKILISLLDSKEFEDKNDKIVHDYITHILNSLQGKLLESLLKITGFWADKFSEKESNNKWNETVERYFTKRLVRTQNADKDFSITLGVYLPWLIFFNKNWVYTNANKIYDTNILQHYKYTLHSSFSPYFRLNKDLYNFFNINKIFSKAIDEFITKSYELDTLTTYALWEWDYLKINFKNTESILCQIFHKKNDDQLLSVIEIVKKNKWLNEAKIKIIIKKLLEVAEGNDDLKQLYPRLLWLLADINILDEDVYNLVDSIWKKISNNSSNTMIFFHYIKHLFKIADSNLLIAGKITICILRNNQARAPHDDNLVVFVNKLYDANYKELADEVCVSVSDGGSLTLREVYSKYH